MPDQSPIIPELCNSIKEKCVIIWESLDAHPKYTEEKITACRSMEDCTLAIQMFDGYNQVKLLSILTVEEIDYIKVLFKHFWYN